MKNENKDRVYVLSGGISPLSFYIPSKDTRRSRLLHTDENGNNRAMRYSKNHKTPFIDEQDDTAIIEPIIFNEGFLSVSKNNKSLQDFLKLHPGNECNGGSVFYEADPEKDAQEKMLQLDLRTDAIIAAKSLDFNTQLSLARVFLPGNIDKMSTAEIKYDLIRFAEDNPEEFMSAIGDTNIDINNLAARAIKDQLVTFRGGKDLFYNIADNKRKIATVPFGTEPVDALASFLGTEQGVDFMKILESMYSE
jgi:hypothetical protein